MTVASLRQDMSADEYMRWSVYHGRRAQKQEMAMQKAKG